MVDTKYDTQAWIAAGGYDAIDDNCLAYAAPKGRAWKPVRAALVSFDEHLWTPQVLDELTELGDLKPASFPQLLAFGVQFPAEQLKEGWIVALGESWSLPASPVEQVPMLSRERADPSFGYGRRMVGLASGEYTRRGLFRHAVQTCWYPGTRFLAVPK